MLKRGADYMNLLSQYSKILIVVDMVKGFVSVGPMSDPTINNITPTIIKLVNDFNNKGELVAFIKDNHESDCLEFKKYPPHCVIGTDEADLIDELKVYEKDNLVYKKNSTSTMFAPNFLKDIEMMTNLKEVVVTGCCTDICVMNLVIPLINYFDQNNRDIKVIVPMNAVETYNSPLHNRDNWNKMAIDFMKQSGAIIKTDYLSEE